MKSFTLKADEFVRCTGCRLHRRLCMCAELPRINTTSRVVLVIHHREIKRPSNTGLLACKCLNNSEVHIRGTKEQNINAHKFPSLDDYDPWLLFPHPTAEPLTPELVSKSQKPVALFVPDGNWGQASRMPRRIEALRNARTVTLPLTIPTEYRLRREVARPEGLATMEAIARAMGILENDVTVEERMIQVMRLMVMRTLWSKGIINTKEANPYLPEALRVDSTCNYSPISRVTLT